MPARPNDECPTESPVYYAGSQDYAILHFGRLTVTVTGLMPPPAPLCQPERLERDDSQQNQERDHDRLVEQIEHQRMATDPDEQPHRQER